MDGRFVSAKGFSTATGLAIPEKILPTKIVIASSDTNNGRRFGNNFLKRETPTSFPALATPSNYYTKARIRMNVSGKITPKARQP